MSGWSGFARHREQIGLRAVQVDAAFLRGSSVADFQQQPRKAKDDLAHDATRLPAGRRRAVMTALHRDVAEAAGAEALGHAGGCEADFVGEVTVSNRG